MTALIVVTLIFSYLIVAGATYSKMFQLAEDSSWCDEENWAAFACLVWPIAGPLLFGSRLPAKLKQLTARKPQQLPRATVEKE